MSESLSKIDRLRMRTEKLKKSIPELTEEQRKSAVEEIQEINKRIKKSLLENRGGKPEKRFEKEIPVPCYFNSGCCIYPNGMTGIEVENGFIRLVKWEKRNCEKNL